MEDMENRVNRLEIEIKDRLCKLESAVYGNGREGLLRNVNRLQTYMKILIGINIGVFVAILSSFVSNLYLYRNLNQ